MSQIPDFLGFTKYDPNNRLLISDDVVDVINGIGGNTRLVYQLPSNVTDFSYNFLYNKTSFSGSTGTFVFAICNQDSQWETSTWSGVGMYHDGGSLYAAQTPNGVGGLATSSGILMNAATNYYITMSRVGNVLTLSVFTDITRTTHATGSPKTYSPALATSFGYLHIQNMLSTHTGSRTNSLSRTDVFPSPVWSTPANKGITTANTGRYYGNGLVIIQLGGGANNGKIVRSIDNGTTFSSIISTGLGTANIIPASDGGVILIGSGSDSAISRSIDNGLTWSPISTGKVENGLANMGGGKYISAGGAPNVVISEDYGLTWGPTIGTNGTQNSMPVYMGNGVVIVGEVTNGNVERSTDYGSTWSSPISTPAANNFYLLNADGILLYGDYLGNITRSLDNGLTWGPLIPTKLTLSPIVLTNIGGGVIYAGDTGSVYVSKSTDYGLTWNLEQTLLADTSTLVYTSENGMLFASSYADGLITYRTLPTNIVATNIGIDSITAPCIAGSCVVTVGVTWTNYGISGTFTPSVVVGITTYSLPIESLSAGASVTHSFEISGLPAGSHTICSSTD